jgi:hypothetical protein
LTDQANVTDWFQRLSAECHLDPVSARALDRDGFVVVTGPVRDDEIDGLAVAYDRAMDAAQSPDKRVGSTSTRVHDVVNRDGAFDALFQHPPVFEPEGDPPKSE